MSEMENTMKTLIASLFASFVLGGIAVYASDQGQDQAITSIEKEAADHEERIRAVEDAQIHRSASSTISARSRKTSLES